MDNTMRSRPIVSTAAFLLAVGGELYLLRGRLAGLSAGAPVPLLAELFLCGGILIGALFSATPKGWRGKAGCWVAYLFLVGYVAFNITQFSFFAALYLEGITTEYPSYGPALASFKLVLVAVGVVAATPVAPGPNRREYADRLWKAAHRQEKTWEAAAAAREADSGGEDAAAQAARRLRRELTPEELERLKCALMAEPAPKMPMEEERMPETGGGAPDGAGGSDEAEQEVPDREAPESPEDTGRCDGVEDWKGWGCG